MTPAPHPDFNGVEFLLTVLDWLDGREVPPVSVDEAFGVLADHRRRLFLEVMRTYDQAITLPDAAEEVASLECDRDVADMPAQRVADVYISLYHDHLPRLVDLGLLEYDQELDLVAPALL